MRYSFRQLRRSLALRAFRRAPLAALGSVSLGTALPALGAPPRPQRLRHAPHLSLSLLTTNPLPPLNCIPLAVYRLPLAQLFFAERFLSLCSWADAPSPPPRPPGRLSLHHSPSPMLPLAV